MDYFISLQFSAEKSCYRFSNVISAPRGKLGAFPMRNRNNGAEIQKKEIIIGCGNWSLGHWAANWYWVLWFEDQQTNLGNVPLVNDWPSFPWKKKWTQFAVGGKPNYKHKNPVWMWFWSDSPKFHNNYKSIMQIMKITLSMGNWYWINCQYDHPHTHTHTIWQTPIPSNAGALLDLRTLLRLFHCTHCEWCAFK